MRAADYIPGLADTLEAALPLTRRRPASSERKAVQDYVTDVDLAVDRFLTEALPKVADVPVFSEERAVSSDGRFDSYWIIDPLDGTANFIAGLPFYGISVALVDRSGPLCAAVISGGDGAIWTASRGGGAARNGAALELAGHAPSELIVLSTGLLDKLSGAHDGVFRTLRSHGKIRNLGSQALHLCGVAGGQFAAVLSQEARVWDEAAGGLILREAGGVWTSAADQADWSDPRRLMAQEQRSIACHPALAAELTDAVSPVWRDDV